MQTHDQQLAEFRELDQHVANTCDQIWQMLTSICQQICGNIVTLKSLFTAWSNTSSICHEMNS